MEIDLNFDMLITDIAISVVDELITQGLVKDYADTRNEIDAVKDALHRYQANFKY